MHHHVRGSEVGDGVHGAIKKNLVSTNPGIRPEYVQKCYNCGEGHKKKDCPYWPKDPTVCWKCHSVGHYYRNCKNVTDKATQTPQKMPMFCRKEGGQHQQRQQENEVYVEMRVREEGDKVPSVVRRVKFLDLEMPVEGIHVPAS